MHWQKERIYNWVRALAYPYPGAYSYYNNSKVIINKINFIDYSFKGTDENGLILSDGDAPIIKTPNGAVQLKEYTCESSVTFEKGKFYYENNKNC